MILVDTSVFIDIWKGRRNPAVDKFDGIMELSIPFGITSHIYQELLQGAASGREFTTIRKYLDTIPLFIPIDAGESFAGAAHIYFKCRKKGITVNSTIDCLIVQIALENRV